MIREIELIVSDRLPIDLAARGLKPGQIARIMEWLSAQTRRTMDRSEVEADLRTMGFSQGAVDGIVVSLVKESVRPQLGKYVIVSLLVLMLALFAILALFRWMLDRRLVCDRNECGGGAFAVNQGTSVWMRGIACSTIVARAISAMRGASAERSP